MINSESIPIFSLFSLHLSLLKSRCQSSITLIFGEGLASDFVSKFKGLD